MMTCHKITVAAQALALFATSATAAEYVITSPSCGPYHLYLCKDPVERARHERRKEALDSAKAAETRAAAEAQARREAEVKDIMKQMNLSPQQEADARRLRDMRAAAEAAKPRLPAATTVSPKPPCVNRRAHDEIVQEVSPRMHTRDGAMAALHQKATGVYDVECSGNDFGWQCMGKRKTGRTLEACVGSAAQ